MDLSNLWVSVLKNEIMCLILFRIWNKVPLLLGYKSTITFESEDISIELVLYYVFHKCVYIPGKKIKFTPCYWNQPIFCQGFYLLLLLFFVFILFFIFSNKHISNYRQQYNFILKTGNTKMIRWFIAKVLVGVLKSGWCGRICSGLIWYHPEIMQPWMNLHLHQY